MPLPDPHIITTGDGKMFRCVVEPKLGIDGTDHWVFTDSDGTRFIGPTYRPIAHPDELRAIVVNWWMMERALRLRESMRADSVAKIEETRQRIRDA